METIEYFRVVDKSGWNDGPWFDEPDKRQWPDAATGLPCILVRGPSGAWCGYVGMPPTHPAHGLHYDGQPDAVAAVERAITRRNMKAWGDAGHPPLDQWKNPEPHPPRPPLTAAGEAISALEVHGGLTFAGGCRTHTREEFEKFRAKQARFQREAEAFPKGDAARFLAQWRDCFDDYDRWCARVQQTAICHLPAPGEPDDIWWFGFDCAHSFDLAPAYSAMMEDMKLRSPLLDHYEEVYRDVAYVAAECAKLAAQLAAIEEVRGDRAVVLTEEGERHDGDDS